MDGTVNPRGYASEPIDPDIDLSHDVVRPRLGDADVVLAVTLGGVAGALARYGADVMWTTSPGTFPWTTIAVNVVGCGLIGILIVIVAEVVRGHRLVRPFLGTGLLGGFTTFSTYTVDSQRLFQTGHEGMAVLNISVTLVAAISAVAGTTVLTRRATVGRR
jgi:CrcB protein